MNVHYRPWSNANAPEQDGMKKPGRVTGRAMRAQGSDPQGTSVHAVVV